MKDNIIIGNCFKYLIENKLQGARMPKLMHKIIPFYLLRNSIVAVCVHQKAVYFCTRREGAWRKPEKDPGQLG